MMEELIEQLKQRLSKAIVNRDLSGNVVHDWDRYHGQAQAYEDAIALAAGLAEAGKPEVQP